MQASNLVQMKGQKTKLLGCQSIYSSQWWCNSVITAYDNNNLTKKKSVERPIHFSFIPSQKLKTPLQKDTLDSQSVTLSPSPQLPYLLQVHAWSTTSPLKLTHSSLHLHSLSSFLSFLSPYDFKAKKVSLNRCIRAILSYSILQHHIFLIFHFGRQKLF